MLFRSIEILAGLLAWIIAAAVLAVCMFVPIVKPQPHGRHVRSIEEEAL